MIKIQNILVPTDFSDAFSHALNYAVLIAKSMESSLHIIHVIEPLVFSSDMIMTKFGFDQLPNELEILAKKNMEKIVKMLTDNDIIFTTKIMHGKADEEILKYTKSSHIDMICMSTHGHGNIENMLFGSTSEKVLRKANCPVLAIRSKD